MNLISVRALFPDVFDFADHLVKDIVKVILHKIYCPIFVFVGYEHGPINRVVKYGTIRAAQHPEHGGCCFIEWLSIMKPRNDNTEVKFLVLPMDWKVQSPGIPRFSNFPVLIIRILPDVINLLNAVGG